MRKMKDSGIDWIGEIPNNKRVLRNKYMFEYTKGRLPESTNIENVGLPYIGASDLDSDNFSTFTTDKTLPDIEYNDLLVLWDGARAGLCGTHKKGKLSSTIVRIRGDKSVYQPFLYWYYKGFEGYMYHWVNGTTIPHMNKKYIEDIGMIDWSLSEQQIISNYLDSKCSKIDEYIAKQQQLIEKLKEYKSSIINEIIVNVEGKSCHLGYISNLKNGLNFNNTSEGHALKFLGVGNFKDFFVLDKKEMFSEIIISDDIAEDYMLHDGDIVFVRSNGSKELVGRSVMVQNIDFPLTYSGFCIRLRNTRPDLINSEFLLYFFRSTYFRKQLEKYSIGSNISNINQDLLSRIILKIPPLSKQEKAVQELKSKLFFIDECIDKKQVLINKLTEYKKSLIYEVVTGKKEV